MAAGIFMVVLAGLGACSGGSAKKSASVSSSGSVAGTSAGHNSADAGAGVSNALGASPAGGTGNASPGAGPAVPPSAPRIVRTGTLALAVDRGKLSKAFDAAEAAASANGGFVADSSTTTTDGSTSARLVLRVPVANFDAVVAAVAALGTAQQKDLKGEDVTGQLVDLGARIDSFRSEENALRTLVGQAKAVGEVLQVQDQLLQVRQQIEQLTAQQGSLDDQATYANIEVRLTEPAAVVGGPARNHQPNPVIRAVRLARTNSAAVARAIVLTLGWAFPLLVLAVCGRLAWPFLRRLRATD
jgi:hypothetical protein